MYDGRENKKMSSIMLPDTTQALRFISCGISSMEGLLFGELFSVFDLSTWFLVLLANIVFLVHSELLKHISGFLEGVKRFLDILNIFLEKSSQTLEFIKQRNPISAAIFLTIMGIVINNAYKNTNVYNVVTPRKNQTS